MSKYAPLERYLSRRSERELPLTFAEVEKVLGFRLPPSARRHAAWWSNNPGTHVGVNAWRNGGWRTSRVDVPGERVTFVREVAGPRNELAEEAAPWRGSVSSERIDVRLEHVLPSALRMLDEMAEAVGGDRSAAVVKLLNDAAVARRRALLDEFASGMPKGASNSVDLIRDGRAERDRRIWESAFGTPYPSDDT